MASHCDLCGEKKPFLFGDFIQCIHCGRIFCPDCWGKFKNMGGYPPRIEMYKCPKCKHISFRGAR